MLWIACSLAMWGAGTEVATAPASTTADIHGSQWQATSPNFAVRNEHPLHDARKVAEHCERWRTKLQKYWIAADQQPWATKCDVVVHAGSGAYLAAVGAGARQTFGSSLIKFSNDKQVARRLIDFRGDSAYGLAAVPHEMTHVVLADLVDGYDKALREVYHLDNVAQLEQFWQEQRLALSAANAGSAFHGVHLALDSAAAEVIRRAE